MFPAVVERLELNARLFPERLAYDDAARAVSWSAAVEEIAAIDTGLRRAGVRPGARVGLLLDNSVDSILALLAVWRGGAVAVVVNPRIDVSAVVEQLATAEATVIAAPPSLRDLATSLGTVTGIDVAPDLAALRTTRPSAEPVVAAPDDHALISFTSGTTGKPKGTLMSYRNLAVRGGTYAVAGALCSRDHGLISTPLCMAGSLNLSLLPYLYGAAACFITPETAGPALVDIVASRGITTMFMVPVVSRRLAEAATRAQLASVRFLMSSGAELPADLLDDLTDRLGIDVHEAAGTSETAGGLYITQPERAMHRRSAGRAIGSYWVEIRDPATGEPVPPETQGEIVIGGVAVGVGYLDGGDVLPFPPTGSATGDIGYQDHDGYVYVTGRIKDTIVTGGQNVYPIDVEEVLRGIPRVREVVVLGCPDPTWGEAVCAVIVPDGAAPEFADIVTRAREKLAGYQVPKRIAIVDELPYTTMGKLDRKALKANWQRLDWQSGSGR
ncbi:class I adenylate-forming enzyme family protein [Phytohabitans kaempferiae]|uniref:Class I adenylate-forming enzyme family protein n=1 Tax=Phytohabitans kaempferiae TaxID=1620943 RepID=A0ABV6M529_9ACTN